MAKCLGVMLFMILALATFTSAKADMTCDFEPPTYPYDAVLNGVNGWVCDNPAWWGLDVISPLAELQSANVPYQNYAHHSTAAHIFMDGTTASMLTKTGWNGPSYASRASIGLVNTSGLYFAEAQACDDVKLQNPPFVYPTVTIPEAKQSAEETAVSCTGIVSAKLGDHFYIEDSNRCAGIRVVALSNGLTTGSEVEVKGVVRTLASGERAITDNPTVTATGNPAIIYPLGMNIKTIGGADFGFPPLGQQGVAGGIGLNNIGLLVRTTGKVGTGGSGTFTLDDGSGVSATVLSYADTIPSEGDYVTVTGVVSCEKDSNQQIQRRLEAVDLNIVSTAIAQTMIDNGSIERVGGGVPAGWSTSVLSGTHSFYVASNAHSGQNCLAINTTQAGLGRWYRTDLYVLQGAKYRLSAWVKTSNTTIAGQIISAAPYNINFVNKLEWTQYTREFTASSTTRTGIYLQSVNGTGQVFFDDVSMTLITPPDTTTGSGQAPCVSGQPIIGIVITSWQEEHEAYLALDARNVIYKMCEIKLPVILKGVENPSLGRYLYIGCKPDSANYDQDLATVGDEGIVLDVTPSAMVCLGNTPRGTYYAVQELYYRLGCRWMLPFTGGECIPSVSQLPLPSGIVHRPSFDLRGGKMMHDYYYPPSMGVQEIDADAEVDWAARNHMNGLMAFYQDTWAYGAIRGGEWMEHSGHTLAALVPAATYFVTHPEYFPLVNGTRVGTGFVQICTSNSDVPGIIAQKVIEYFDRNPKAERFSVSQNDGPWGWCECANCKALDTVSGLDWSQNTTGGGMDYMADRWMYLVNRVADIVAQKYPGKILMTYAYSSTINPPTRYLPHFNVQVELTWNGRCFKHLATDPACSRNQTKKNLFDGWRILAPMSVYGYGDFFYPEAPEPYFHSDGDFYKYVHNNGVRMVSDEWDTSWSAAPLLLNLRARLLWDVDTDVDAFITDFCNIVYGPAANTIKQFFLGLENAVYNSPSSHVSICDMDKFTDTVLSNSLSLLTTAASQAGSDQTLLGRIARLRMSVLYAQMCKLYIQSYSDPYVLPQVDPIRTEISSLIQTYSIPVYYTCNMWESGYRPPSPPVW